MELERIYKLTDCIEELQVSARLYNLMKSADIHTLRKVLDYPESHFKRLRNAGKKTTQEFMDLKEFIKKHLLPKYIHYGCEGALVPVKDQAGIYQCMKCADFLVHPDEYPGIINKGLFVAVSEKE